MTQPVAYHPVAKSLHWLIAALILALLVVGHVMDELPKGPLRALVYDIHKQVGVAVILLGIARIAWRLAMGAPPLPDSMPARDRLLAHAAHFALYVLMLAMPAAGVLMSQSGGHPVVLLGMPVPVLVAKAKDLNEFFESAHGLLGWATVGLVTLHVAAALDHRFRRKDGIMARMLPRCCGGRCPP